MAEGAEEATVSGGAPGADGGQMDVTEKKDGGVVKEILQEGTEGDIKPAKGNTVYVHYVGTLESDGSKFDSSRDRGDLFSFHLGKGEVIKAWDLGVATMKKGEKCRLTCKPEYAYGKTGSPPKIPADATLIFEVELFRWEGEDLSSDKDKSILRSIQVEGKGYDTPNDGSNIEAHVIARCEGREFLNKDLNFTLGEGTEAGLPEGLDKAVKRMKKGERALIDLAPRAGYGKNGQAAYGIGPDAHLEFDVTLKDFVKVKDSWQMNDEEKLETSEALKARGTEFFQQGKIKLALAKYKRIEDLLEYEKSLEGEKKAKREALLLAAHLNMALCFLKKNETVETIKHCEKAMEMEGQEQNVKALYRRGQAYQQQRDWEEALGDYERLLAVEPENRAVRGQIAACKAALALQHRREKAIFGGMFDKFSKVDAKKKHAEEEEHRQRVFPEGAANGEATADGDGKAAGDGKTAAEDEEEDDDPPPPPLE